MKQQHSVSEILLVMLGCIAVLPQIYNIIYKGVEGVEIGFYLLNLIYHSIAAFYVRRSVFIVNTLFLVKNAIVVFIMMFYSNITVEPLPAMMSLSLILSLFHKKRFEIATLLCYILTPCMLYYGIIKAIVSHTDIQLSITTLSIYVFLHYLEYDRTKEEMSKVYAYLNLWASGACLLAIPIIIIYGNGNSLRVFGSHLSCHLFSN